MNQSMITRTVNLYAEATAKAKIAAEAVTVLKAKLSALGVGTYTGTEHKVVITESLPVRFDVSAFREAHPTLHAEFNKATTEPVTSVRIYGR